jgi:transcriptional regulator with XRE-family HTH domain
MITGAQCRAGRALAQIAADELARGTGVELAVVREFERRLSRPSNEIVSMIERFLEASGVMFIPENGGGVGVRLKFSASETRRIGVLESEGGIIASDDVP